MVLKVCEKCWPKSGLKNGSRMTKLAVFSPILLFLVSKIIYSLRWICWSIVKVAIDFSFNFNNLHHIFGKECQKGHKVASKNVAQLSELILSGDLFVLLRVSTSKKFGWTIFYFRSFLWPRPFYSVGKFDQNRQISWLWFSIWFLNDFLWHHLVISCYLAQW